MIILNDFFHIESGVSCRELKASLLIEDIVTHGKSQEDQVFRVLCYLLLIQADKEVLNEHLNCRLILRQYKLLNLLPNCRRMRLKCERLD